MEHPLKNLIKTENLPHEFCPGCAIGQVYHWVSRAINELGIDINKVVLVSGIGCCARGVRFVRCDALTTLHGRAIAFATGIKLANPNLNVIVVTGDGDGSGIGGNHLIHAARRNLELTVVLLNNGVYASTGGQVAPTTPHGAYTPTTPFGNVEDPFDLCKLLEVAGAVYVARWTTYHVRPAIESIKKGIKKKGFSFIEIMGQCPTYLGRYILKLYEPVECINWFKNNSIRKELIGNLSKEELANKIIVGEFVDKEKMGLVERYQKLYGKI